MIPTTALLLALCSAAMVGACTDSSEDTRPEAVSPETSGSHSPDDRDASTPAPSVMSTSVDDLVAAGQAARALLPGSVVVDLDHELPGDYWEVELFEPGASAHQVKVSADGSQVIEGPTAQADSDADTMQRRGRLAKATVDFEGAARAIASRYPNSAITELGLDDSGGRVVWEADVVAADGTSHEMAIDATSGEVMSDGVHGS